MNEIKDKDYPGVNTPNRKYGWGGIRTTLDTILII